MRSLIGLLLLVASLSCVSITHASDLDAAVALHRQGHYFKAARYAFSALGELDSNQDGEAYSIIVSGLMDEGLPQAAVYFYIRTLQTKNPSAIRRVLTYTEKILTHVGGDLIRRYLIQYTNPSDFDDSNRSAFYYVVGKDALLKQKESLAIDSLNRVSSNSSLYPYALELRATAFALKKQYQESINDFGQCVKRVNQLTEWADRDKWSQNKNYKTQVEQVSLDLKNRCQAGIARIYYEVGEFKKADEAYDQIPKASFIWTDILFEQAWNAFAQGEFNRTLGKLVSYKSPDLEFVSNSEIDVLKAQSYLALCLYEDANQAINDFNAQWTKLGIEIKRFVENNSSRLASFYEQGKNALSQSHQVRNPFYRFLNRFIRGPYFQTLVLSEKEINNERNLIAQLGRESATRKEPRGGFPAFLNRVLNWRKGTVQSLGGAFVKNSLIDYHGVLISDFEKIAFIKLEMLSRAKDRLLNRSSLTRDRNRGNEEPERKAYQYYWSFNGEFWNDELGDYVFGLESQCDKDAS